MKEEEEENIKDLCEIGALNLLIAPLHIPLLPRKFESCRGGGSCTTSARGREGKGRGEEGRKEALGERELWCRV
jgi:hypothetical protein